ncbi:MAG: hypothetical protein QOK15_1099 [Nocardioidaceae bacterium]|nr:hypothetical protein [Nocardioidaceae bacterium]
MTRRAFLHIGLPKTGTTYLQQVLWENKARLAELGVLLPGATRRRHLLASLDVREDPRLARRSGDVSAPWQDLVEECLHWDGDVLVSHEFFGAASTEQVRRLVDSLPGFDVHPVITARAMSDLGVSRWQEWVKSGGALPVDEYPRKREYDPTDEWGWGSFDLADILDRWAAALPPERIQVLPIAPGRGSPDELWSRFAEVLGLDGREFTVPQVPANPSLGVVEVELLRRINPLLHDFKSAADRGNWIRGFLAEGGILPNRREKFRAGAEKQKQLVERGDRALRLLRDGRFDVRGDLECLRPGYPSGVRHPSEVTDDEMLESATIAIANMLRTIRSLTEERDAQREALRSRSPARRAAVAAGQIGHWWHTFAPAKRRKLGKD